MIIDPGTPLTVSLQWDIDDIQPVGRLAYRDRIAYLEYDPAFLQTGLELSPVRHRSSTQLESPHRSETFEGLHGFLNDSLPDGWGRLLVDRRARQLGLEPSSLTPLDRLACVGSKGIGALTYEPSNEVWGPTSKTLDLDKLATDASLVLKGDVSELISILGKVGGSPGGARPKALIAINDQGHAIHGTDNVPDGYVHYLVKFAGHGDPEDIAEIEMAYALMAKEAGVIMPETKLLEGSKGRPYFATRRFDREGTRRFHVHSASGLLYTDIRIPALDYKDLLLLTRSVTRDQRESKAMFALAVFNVLAHNRDDHARQFSYIMERDGTWRMAPAYDLTWSEGPGGEHSTSVLGHGKNVTSEHLFELGRIADIKPQDVKEVVARVEVAVANWNVFASECGVSKNTSSLIEEAITNARL